MPRDGGSWGWRYSAAAMAKTLVIAEKPSVGRDLARVLPGPFAKHGAGTSRAPEHIITWAVGHLVQLAEPDEYDAKFKKWRMADLPIVPEHFKLVVRDERSKKQMTVVSRQLERDDVDLVVNACDAGREGELIFAYLYEKAGAKKPVQRLWLQLDDQAGDARGVRRTARRRRAQGLARAGRALALGGRLDRRHERHARRHDPPALLVRRRRLARARADADAGHHRPPRGGDPRVQARAVLARRRARSPPSAEPPATRAASTPAPSRGSRPRPRRQAIVAAVRRADRRDHQARQDDAQKQRPPLLYDLTSLQREANTRFGFSARRTLAAAQRCYEEHKALTYPRTSSRYLTSDMVAEIKPTAALVGPQQPSTARPPST